MTAEVIDIQSRQPHISGPAVCLQCKHKWIAVAPSGTNILDCPECGLGKGIFANLCFPEEGQESWSCNCGNGYFMVRPHGCMCIMCGKMQVFDF